MPAPDTIQKLAALYGCDPARLEDLCARHEKWESLPDYIKALIWYNGTIADGKLIIRNQDAYYPTTIGRFLRGTLFDLDGQTVFRASNPIVISALRAAGVTGRKDSALPPPCVDPLSSAQALTESHGSFGWALRYYVRGSTDKNQAYYVPHVRVCASEQILQSYVDTLHAAGIIPPRQLTFAANGTSRTVTFTSRRQLIALYGLFEDAPLRHARYWDQFYLHISSPAISYHQYHSTQKHARKTNGSEQA